MKTNKKIGLYVGKFVAYHKGHQYYINKFARSCDILNLVLCSNTKTDLVPYQVRHNWLQKDLKQGLFNVKDKIKLHLSMEDDITPYPDGIREWCNWIEHLTQNKIDIIFGNDDYVKECSYILGAKYYCPDHDRKFFNISSTKIFKSGLKYYDFLTDVSKPYFNKKILFLGAESSGKTSLCKKLSLYFKAPFVAEYGRIYEEQTVKFFNKRCSEWKVEDYEKIAATQSQMIQNLIEKPNNKLIFVDTDSLTTKLYCELYLGRSSSKLKDYVAAQNFDLIILLDHSDTNWVDDGIRTLQGRREEVLEKIKNNLTDLNREFILVKNKEGYESRFEEVKNLIKNKFNL